MKHPHFHIWDNVLKNEPSKLCGRQPLKNLKLYGVLKETISLQILKRLSLRSFTWSILQYFCPFETPEMKNIKKRNNFIWKWLLWMRCSHGKRNLKSRTYNSNLFESESYIKMHVCWLFAWSIWLLLWNQ